MYLLYDISLSLNTFLLSRARDQLILVRSINRTPPTAGTSDDPSSALTAGYLPTRSEALIYTGFILGGVSKASMLRRKLRQLILVKTEETQLLLFRSLADYRKWNADVYITDDGERRSGRRAPGKG